MESDAPDSPGLDVRIVRLDPDLPLPRYAHVGDAGADLYAASDVCLSPGQRTLVPTGVAMSFPAGYVALVHPRSGLAAKHGISIVNSPGTIDSGYRGEIKVCLINTDPVAEYDIARGDRIAQVVFQKVETATFVEVSELDSTARGASGYGSTGGFNTPSAREE